MASRWHKKNKQLAVAETGNSNFNKFERSRKKNDAEDDDEEKVEPENKNVEMLVDTIVSANDKQRKWKAICATAEIGVE